MYQAGSLFENWFRPRLESRLSSAQSPMLSDLQKSQLKRWTGVLNETDESLQTRSKQRQSVRRRARTFAKNVHVISAKLFDLCSLSFTISALPSIQDGSFYDEMRAWWTAQIPKPPIFEYAKDAGRGVQSNIQSKDDSTIVSAHVSANSNKSGDFTFRPETEIPQNLMHLCDAPQEGLFDAVLTEQAQDTPLSSTRDDFSRSKSDSNFPPPGDFERLHLPSKRPRMDLHYVPENPSSRHGNQYLSFNFTRRHMIDKLPEPFKTGIQNSRQWRAEQEIGGLSVTNCLSLYMPEKENKDTFLVVRMGYLDGFQMSDLLGIGDPETPETLK